MLCFTATNSFKVHLKLYVIYADLTKYVETRFDKSSYEFELCPMSNRKKTKK